MKATVDEQMVWSMARMTRPGDVVVVGCPMSVVSGDASGNSRTKKKVKAIIPRMTSGRIQRPGFGSGLMAMTFQTLAALSEVPWFARFADRGVGNTA